MKFTRKKIILCIIFIFAIGFICLLINRNTGLKAFEKEVLNIELPQNIEKIAMKYFSTFDDDLKILYLTKAYERLDPSMLSMSPYLCAELLVQRGTFEGGQ